MFLSSHLGLQTGEWERGSGKRDGDKDVRSGGTEDGGAKDSAETSLLFPVSQR